MVVQCVGDWGVVARSMGQAHCGVDIYSPNTMCDLKGETKVRHQQGEAVASEQGKT